MYNYSCRKRPYELRRQAKGGVVLLNFPLLVAMLFPSLAARKGQYIHSVNPKEHVMLSDERAVIAANLCGCVIEGMTITENQVTLALHEPRQGQLSLICREAMIVDSAFAYPEFAAQPRWKRTIEWVDVLDDDVFYLCFQNGSNWALRAAQAEFAKTVAAH